MPDMLLCSAWLYTRGKDSVRIELRDEETRFLLIVHGPGSEWAHQICADHVEALQVQLSREARLLAQGFVLEGYEQWQPLRRPKDSPVRSGSSRSRPADTLHLADDSSREPR